MLRKKFITIEGCEGAGKSGQMKLLQAYCAEHGIDALFTREPGGSRIAEEIRRLILSPENKEMTAECEMFLFAAARTQHLSEVIVPALQSGKIVFCDRFVDSSYAYQGFGRGLGLDYVKSVNKYAVKEYMPDITIFMDLPPEDAFKRKGGADLKDRMEKCENGFFEKIYEGYKEVAKRERHRYFVVKPTGTKHETHAIIVDYLKSRGVF